MLDVFGRRERCKFPLKKVTTLEDGVRQIVILSSPIASGHVPGGILMVDGGVVAVT